MKTIAILLTLCAPARAYVMRYQVAKPDAMAIIDRLETATGLNFQGKFRLVDGQRVYDVPVHGSLTAGNGGVTVEVYDTPRPAIKNSAVTEVTPDLQAAITAAVLNQ